MARKVTLSQEVSLLRSLDGLSRVQQVITLRKWLGEHDMDEVFVKRLSRVRSEWDGGQHVVHAHYPACVPVDSKGLAEWERMLLTV